VIRGSRPSEALTSGAPVRADLVEDAVQLMVGIELHDFSFATLAAPSRRVSSRFVRTARGRTWLILIGGPVYRGAAWSLSPQVRTGSTHWMSRPIL
jgi:hypothetical protein